MKKNILAITIIGIIGSLGLAGSLIWAQTSYQSTSSSSIPSVCIGDNTYPNGPAGYPCQKAYDQAYNQNQADLLTVYNSAPSPALLATQPSVVKQQYEQWAQKYAEALVSSLIKFPATDPQQQIDNFITVLQNYMTNPLYQFSGLQTTIDYLNNAKGSLPVFQQTGARVSPSRISPPEVYRVWPKPTQHVSKGAPGAETSMPMVITIGPSGQTTIRGTLVSVSSSSLVLQSWGNSQWTISVSDNTEILPKNSGGVANFQTGDFIGVIGTINQSQDLTIDARIVRDWTYKKISQGRLNTGLTQSGVTVLSPNGGDAGIKQKSASVANCTQTTEGCANCQQAPECVSNPAQCRQAIGLPTGVCSTPSGIYDPHGAGLLSVDSVYDPLTPSRPYAELGAIPSMPKHQQTKFLFPVGGLSPYISSQEIMTNIKPIQNPYYGGGNQPFTGSYVSGIPNLYWKNYVIGDWNPYQ